MSEYMEIDEEASDFEKSKIAMLMISENRAWSYVKILALLCALLVIAMAILMPLKETVPYLVRVDNSTGATDIVTRLDISPVEFEEVMDKHWLARYVVARESYDWYTLQADYDLVGMLSTKNIGAAYLQLFEGKGDIQKQYVDKYRVITRINSIVLNGQGIATIRFEKELQPTDNLAAKGEVTRWVATIGYFYANPSFINEQERLKNPLGFQVISYRIDPEAAF